MSAFITVTLAPHGLELRCPAANLSEDRVLSAEEAERLQEWSKQYLAATRQRDNHATFLKIGQELLVWLNGASSFLSRAIESASPPVLIEFAVAKTDTSELAKALLDAPWELLASDGDFWALRPDLVFCPIRRLGKTLPPPAPAPHRLGLVFMAAAPRGADNLDYEAEEASILDATRHLGLDLTVEESGTLALLSMCVAREKPEAIQISCHGTLKPRPGLLLEDETGDRDFVESGKLVSKLAAHHPRLLLLSACETAQADPVLPSLARSLVLAGTPAVLGWAAPVRDREATLFSALLYGRLTGGEDLAHALAYARLELAENELLPEPSTPGPRSHDWHLARLFLSSNGGGPLATASGKTRHLGQGQAAKTFLDAKGKQVPVAGEQEFVGRRREIQAILKEFRAPNGTRHAGVFVHGVGRQGKSSLAARVARRLEVTHETVVIFGRYDAPFILRTLGEHLATEGITQIVNRFKAQVEADPSQLLPALTAILEGECAQADGKGAKPVLLVIDEFEQALKDSNHRTLKPEYFDSIRALLQAFGSATTESRLLFTCRYQFTCPHGAQDLADADHLLDVPLHGMNERESRKQADAKLRLPGTVKPSPQKLEALAAHLDRIIANARGNPGLQDLLFSLALENPTACDNCLAQMETYLQGGTLPTEDKIRKFLENLALGSLKNLLTDTESELLRAATLFDLPVPVSVMETLASLISSSRGNEALNNSPGTGQSLLTSAATNRLLALGLFEVYEDLHFPQNSALALNALVRPLAGTLTEAEQTALAREVITELFAQWGGETGGKQRGYLQDCELTRLALSAKAAPVLAATGADALRYLDKEFKYQQAAAWAKEMVAVLDQAGVPASMDLLRSAAERCQQVGEVKEANTLRARAMELIGKGEQAGTVDHAATLITHARALVEQGQPDAALHHLEQAKALLPPGREQAIVMGDIARIRRNKGEVDAALQLHQEAFTIYEALGDKRERAVTLGDIARIRAAKGEVDAALQLHQEAFTIYEALGDKRERAVTLGDIARIRADKGEVEAALQLHQERLAVNEALGDKRERALTLGDIARICADKGEVDAALQLHQEAIAIYEALGDKRSRAVTLGDIARIVTAKGEVDTALQLHQEQLAIFEALGDKRARAVTLGDIARIRTAKGEMDAALQLHHEKLAIVVGLGDLDGQANTLWAIAQVEIQHEKWQEAFDHLSESYSVLLKIGRLDGICIVGLDLGQLLCLAGQREQGLIILNRSREGFLKLGRQEMVKIVEKHIQYVLNLKF